MGAHWETLAPGYRVWVTKEHGFTTDTLLLADFARPRRGEACADFGTGCGAIPLLWAARGEPSAIWGIEVQEGAAGQARRSVEESRAGEHITILHGDVREIQTLLPHESLDLIACNPPYQAAGRGLASPDPARAQARQGDTLSLEELARAAKFALKFGGRLCICLRVPRLAEAMGVFRSAGLEPKRLRLVQQRVEKAPYLFLLECRKGGRPGLEAEPVLLLEGPEMERIYEGYKEGAYA